MSQAKVDRYKKEKKNRGKKIKRKKVASVAWILVFAALVGSLIGVPVGKKLYQRSVEKRDASETITASLYQYWLDEYWSTNVSDTLSFTNDDLADSLTGTDTDAAASETDAK